MIEGWEDRPLGTGRKASVSLSLVGDEHVAGKGALGQDLASASHLQCSYSFDLGQIASSTPNRDNNPQESSTGWDRQRAIPLSGIKKSTQWDVKPRDD